jgi:hypothetical protein
VTTSVGSADSDADPASLVAVNATGSVPGWPLWRQET